MGQYWDIASLDRRQKVELGKLGECLFSGGLFFITERLYRQSMYLVDLERDDNPPHRDQTVSSAPSVSYNTFGSLDPRDHQESYPSKRSKTTMAIAAAADRDHDVSSRGLESKSHRTPIRYFTLLPTELIDIIYTYLPGHISVIFFALTSRRHWQIGRPHIRSRVLALTTWAGGRIICVGDSCWGNDVPPGLELTSAEKTELREGRTKRDATEGFWSDDEDGGLEDTECSTLFDLVDRFRSSVDICGVTAQLCPRPGLSDIRTKTSAYELFLALTYDRHREGSDLFYLHRLVLRNLSRNECVHEKTVNEFTYQYSKQHRGSPIAHDFVHVGLGHIVVMRTAWSSDHSLRYEGDFHRGAWAGDRFDVVRESEFMEANREGKWKDVSMEVLTELLAVWKAQYRRDP